MLLIVMLRVVGKVYLPGSIVIEEAIFRLLKLVAENVPELVETPLTFKVVRELAVIAPVLELVLEKVKVVSEVGKVNVPELVKVLGKVKEVIADPILKVLPELLKVLPKERAVRAVKENDPVLEKAPVKVADVIELLVIVPVLVNDPGTTSEVIDPRLKVLVVELLKELENVTEVRELAENGPALVKAPEKIKEVGVLAVKDPLLVKAPPNEPVKVP